MPLTKPALSLGTAGETTREPHGLPAVKTTPRPYRTRRCTGEMISGPPLSGQPGKAVGHAVGKLTLRHDLAATHCPYNPVIRDRVSRTPSPSAQPAREFATMPSHALPPGQLPGAVGELTHGTAPGDDRRTPGPINSGRSRRLS